MLAVRGGDHLEGVTARDGRVERGVDLVGVEVKRKLIQRHVAGVAARRVGVGGQAVNHRAVGEARFQLLDHRALEERGLARPGDDAARLDVLVHLLHQQARLPLALREEDPGGAPFQALEHGPEGGRKGEAGLPALHHNLERRIVLDPAPLVGQKLEGRPLSVVRCHLLVLGFQFSVLSFQFSVGPAGFGRQEPTTEKLIADSR